MRQLSRDLRVYRRLLALAGGIYLAWWFMVELVLPNQFNPLPGRLATVAIVWLVLALSYLTPFVRDHLRAFTYGSLWLITLHYYYLFYHNANDINWVVGCFITVIAVNLCLLSNTALLSYSGFVMALSGGLVYLVPGLRQSVFLPGVVTILAQANLGLRSRLGILRHLALSNDRFRFLFDSTFEGILVHEKGHVVDVNESLAKILGYKKEDLVDFDVLNFVHPDEREKVAAKLKLEDVPPYLTRAVHKNGQPVDIEVRGKNFIYNNRTARLVNIQDIRDRKKVETERVAAAALVENVRLRDEFISIASHELKTPISALKLQTQLIERDLKKLSQSPQEPKKIFEATELFHRQIDRLTELIDTMLDVSRIAGGQFNLEFEDFDFSQLVRETVTVLFGNQLGTSVTIDSPEHVRIRADRKRMRQVLENLLNNAAKYGDGKPIVIRLVEEDTDLRFSVADQGIGISQADLARIFDRFERAVSARNISGLGLGLYIVKQIIEAHSGRIEVDSALGHGSSFTVRLPLH